MCRVVLPLINIGLIEAYWNVNILLVISGVAALVGLIEAYWNVNF